MYVGLISWHFHQILVYDPRFVGFSAILVLALGFRGQGPGALGLSAWGVKMGNVTPRGSTYPIFEVSGPKKCTLASVWDQRASILGTWIPWAREVHEPVGYAGILDWVVVLRQLLKWRGALNFGRSSKVVFSTVSICRVKWPGSQLLAAPILLVVLVAAMLTV